VNLEDPVPEEKQAMRSLTPFINVPSEIPASLPRERFDHTSTLVDFGRLTGKLANRGWTPECVRVGRSFNRIGGRALSALVSVSSAAVSRPPESSSPHASRQREADRIGGE
jgi:hypothetical protein